MLNKSYFFVSLISFITLFSAIIMYATSIGPCDWGAKPIYKGTDVSSPVKVISCPNHPKVEQALNGLTFIHYGNTVRYNYYIATTLLFTMGILTIIMLILALRFPNLCIQLHQQKQLPSWPETDKYLVRKVFSIDIGIEGIFTIGAVLFILLMFAIN